MRTSANGGRFFIMYCRDRFGKSHCITKSGCLIVCSKCPQKKGGHSAGPCCYIVPAIFVVHILDIEAGIVTKLLQLFDHGQGVID